MALTTLEGIAQVGDEPQYEERYTVSKTIKMTPSQAQKLDDFCFAIKERSQNKVIREAIDQYIANHSLGD